MLKNENISMIERVPRNSNFRRSNLLATLDMKQSRFGLIFDVIKTGSHASPEVLDAVGKVGKEL